MRAGLEGELEAGHVHMEGTSAELAWLRSWPHCLLTHCHALVLTLTLPFLWSQEALAASRKAIEDELAQEEDQ